MSPLALILPEAVIGVDSFIEVPVVSIIVAFPTSISKVVPDKVILVSPSIASSLIESTFIWPTLVILPSLKLAPAAKIVPLELILPMLIVTGKLI